MHLVVLWVIQNIYYHVLCMLCLNGLVGLSNLGLQARVQDPTRGSVPIARQRPDVYLRSRRNLSPPLSVRILKPLDKISPAATERGRSMRDAPSFSMISTAAYGEVQLMLYTDEMLDAHLIATNEHKNLRTLSERENGPIFFCPLRKLKRRTWEGVRDHIAIWPSVLTMTLGTCCRGASVQVVQGVKATVLRPDTAILQSTH